MRSQARFLRQRLEEYFNTAGAQEPLLLLIPKGSYVPAFERREVQAAVPVPAGSALPVHSAAGANNAPRSARRFSTLATILLALLVLGVFALAAAYWNRSIPQAATASEDPSVSRFWSSIFEPRRPLLIVPADSSLVLMEELNGHSVPLDSYINKDYMKGSSKESAKLWELVTASQYTNIADLNLVARLERAE